MSQKSERMQPIERVFKFGDKVLADPGIHMTPEEVMDLYSRQYPSLTKGEIGGPYYEDEKENWKFEGKGPSATYDLKGSYGTKG
jgi:PRTRC genetic system protein C